MKDLVLKHKSGHWVPLCRLILLLLGQSTALYSLLKAYVPQWGLTGQNGVTYVHKVTFCVLKVWTQHLFVLVPIGVHWFLGTKCGQPLTHLSFTQS